MSVNVPSGYKQTKVGVIPEDWGCLPASNYFSKRIAKGYEGLEIYSVTISKSWQKRSELGRDIGSDVDVNKSLLVETGDLVYNTMRMWQGALGMAENAGVVSPAYIVLRPKSMINSKFAFYMLKSYTYLHYLTSYSYGLTSDRLRLYFKDFGMIPFICPPLEEQAKIVKILAIWDDAITKQESLIKVKEELKKGLIQKLLSREVRFDGFDGEWEEVRLGDIGDIYQPQTISQKEFTTEGYPVYGANGLIGMYHSFNHELWQILITCRGSTSGKVSKSKNRSWITGNAMVVNVDHNVYIDKDFFYYLLTNHSFKNIVEGSGQPQITRKPLQVQLFNLPPKQEQQKIAQVLTSSDKEIDLLKNELESLKEQKRGLMQRLLSGGVRVKV